MPWYVLSISCSQGYDRLLITSWGHDPGVVPTSNVLTMLNDALTHSAVLIQVQLPYFKQSVVDFNFKDFNLFDSAESQSDVSNQTFVKLTHKQPEIRILVLAFVSQIENGGNNVGLEIRLTFELQPQFLLPVWPCCFFFKQQL